MSVKPSSDNAVPRTERRTSAPRRGTPASPALVRRAAPWAFVVLALLATYGLATGSPYAARLATVFGIYGALALSLNLVVRFVGQYSLAHSALFAVGAYVSAILAEHWSSVSPFLLLPLCVLAAAGVGLLLGAVSLRMGGLYFAIFTLVFAIAFSVGLDRWSSLTGGSTGIIGPEFPENAGFSSSFGDPLVWCVAALVGIALLLTWNLRSSPAYPVLTAVKESERLARAFAIPITAVKLGVFTLSAGIAGAAGWAFSFLGVVSPGSFTYVFSVTILVMVLLGGMNNLVGPLLGAAFVVYFPEYVSITGQSRDLLYGALLIVALVAVPGGLAGVAVSAYAGLRRRLGHRPEADALPSAAPQGAEVSAPVAAPDDRPAAPTPGAVAVDCRGVSFRYNEGAYALRDVDVRVDAGTIHGLIGANGSGKSTLLDVISGFQRPLEGTVTIFGEDVHHAGVERRARLGVRRTFQTADIIGHLTCLENVVVAVHQDIAALPVRAPLWQVVPGSRAAGRRVEKACRASLAWAGIEQWADHPAASVPHAVQQLLQVARVHASRPRMVLLDEPAAGLTQTEVGALADRLRALKDLGVTVVIVEHLVHFIFGLCDAVTVLDAGRLVESGLPRDIRASAEVQRVYLGMNLDV